MFGYRYGHRYQKRTIVRPCRRSHKHPHSKYDKILQLAASEGKLEVVKFLIANGWKVQIDKVDGDRMNEDKPENDYEEDYDDYDDEDHDDNDDEDSYLREVGYPGEDEEYDEEVEEQWQKPPRNYQRLEQQTPLYNACKNHHWAVAEFLMSQGANKHFALIIAAESGDVKTAEYLVDNGAEIDEVHIRNRKESIENSVWRRETPLCIAVEQGHLNMVEFLLKSGADKDRVRAKDFENPLRIAAIYALTEIARLLVEQGAITDQANHGGSTPLHHAARNGCEEIARLLLKHGAGKDKEDYNEATPLHHAVRSRHFDIIQLLVEEGANKCKAERIHGCTPLHIAVGNNDDLTVGYLLKKGADKDKPMLNGDTPLARAVRKGLLDVTSLLLEKEADIDKPNRDGEAPLHLAVHRGGLEVVRLLLEQGADRDKANLDRQTPLHLAAAAARGYWWDDDEDDEHDEFLFQIEFQVARDSLGIAKLLMAYGADLNLRNRHGQLPIDVARGEEMKQAIRDEPRRRMDHGYKRYTEQDQQPTASASANAQQEEEEHEEQSNKRPRLDQEVQAGSGKKTNFVSARALLAEEEVGKTAEEDEDSEPSDEDDD